MAENREQRAESRRQRSEVRGQKRENDEAPAYTTQRRGRRMKNSFSCSCS